MKYCGECGKKNEANKNFCVYCGEKLEAKDAGFNVRKRGNDTSHPNIMNEGITHISIIGNKVKIMTIIKILAILLCLLFFFPFYSFNVRDSWTWNIMKYNVSGFEAAFGKNLVAYGERMKGNIFAVLPLLNSLALFAIFQFGKNLAFTPKKLYIISTVLSILGVIELLIFTSIANNFLADSTMTPDYVLAYYLSFVFYILAGLISIGCISSIKKMT